MKLVHYCTILALAATTFISPAVYAQMPAGQAPAGNAAAQQTGKLLGRLTDAKGQPVAYATVTLFRTDSSVANGALTKDNGSFAIEPTGIGKFRMRVSAIGFQEKMIDVVITPESSEKDLGKITLAATSTHLKEVEITGERPVMEMSVDKKVFNVEKNITTAGGSASDVLANVPSVSVDVDGNVSLRGKGNVTILIDGKPATLLGGDAVSALQTLPAASIQNVEVITNPSAKYDAQGMTGIINIVTKKDAKFGLNGTATLGAGTRDKYNGNLSLNLKNKKWNIFANSSFRLNSNYNRTNTSLETKDGSSSSRTDEDAQRKFNGWFNTLGADYTIDDHNSITLTENINLMRFGGYGLANYRLYDATGDMTLDQRRYSDRTGGPFSLSSNLDYKHKFHKEKQELTANANFTKSWMKMTQSYITDSLDGNEVPYTGRYNQNSPASGSNSSMNAQVDFTTPFLGRNGKLDAGLKAQLFWFESSNNPTITDPSGNVKTDSLLINGYNYSQKTYAGYVNYSNQVGKFTYQAGLRLEDFLYDGTMREVSNGFSKSFVNLFPSVFVSYKLPQDQSMYINYSRRTNRPDFRQLMPYLDLSNPQEISSGNPELSPEFVNNVELSYSKNFKQGHSFIASVYYQYTENMINQYRNYDTATGITFTMPENLQSGITYGLELIGRAQILPIWDMTLTGNFFQNEIKGSNIDPSLNNSGFSWLGKMNSNLRLPKGFSLQINGNYESPKITGQGKLEDAWWLDLGLRKNLMKNKATIVFNVSDIFNTRKYTTNYNQPFYYQSIYRDRETRVANITFTWRFGKSDLKQAGGRRKGNNNQQTQDKDKERDNLKGDDSNDQGGF